MNFRQLLILFFFAFFGTVHAQKRPETLEKHLEVIKTDTENAQSLLFLCEYYLKQGDYSKVVTYAEYMKNLTEKHPNNLIRLQAHLYLGQAQMMSGREKIARKNLDAALDLASQQDNDTIRCTLY